jgi:FkbM family methyltransferase
MNFAKLAKLMARPRYWRAIAAGVAPGIEHRAALAGLRPATVIDVGANKGQFAYLAETLWPSAQIVCFEPLPGPRARLTELMGERARIYDCALGQTEGSATIHIASREDSSSLLPLGRQRELFRMDEAASLEVPVRRLDELMTSDLAAPILLKIDVQGFEHEVLNGAERLLPHIDWVYVEASFVELYQGQKLADEVTALLAGHGFRITGEYNTVHFDGKPVQADLLFTAERLCPASRQSENPS